MKRTFFFLTVSSAAVLGLVLHKARGGALPPMAGPLPAVDRSEHRYRLAEPPVNWSRFLRQ